MTRSRPRTVPLAEAKSHFAECVRAAENGDPVIITRHGKPVAALVSAQDLAVLHRVRAADEGHGLAALAGGWPGSEELGRLAQKRRRTSRKRRRPA
jgi:prevent-host-death family protein